MRQYRAEFGDATPIIMLTAEGDEKIKAARAAGASDAIAKPFEPLQLFAAIDKYLKQ